MLQLFNEICFARQMGHYSKNKQKQLSTLKKKYYVHTETSKLKASVLQVGEVILRQRKV